MGPRVDFLVRRLQEEGQALAAQWAVLADSAWMTPVYPVEGGPWTMHNILAHLRSAEGYLWQMIADVAGGGPGAPQGIDINAVNAAEVADLSRFSPAELIARVDVSRRETVTLVLSLADDDLDRRGNHPLLGEMPLEEFVKLIYRHDKMHLRDAQRALKAV